MVRVKLVKMDYEKGHLFHFYPKIVDCVPKRVVDKLGLSNNVKEHRFLTVGPYTPKRSVERV